MRRTNPISQSPGAECEATKMNANVRLSIDTSRSCVVGSGDETFLRNEAICAQKDAPNEPAALRKTCRTKPRTFTERVPNEATGACENTTNEATGDACANSVVWGSHKEPRRAGWCVRRQSIHRSRCLSAASASGSWRASRHRRYYAAFSG